MVSVVHRLFQIIKPDRAYFGEKDYQQARIVEEMAGTRHLKVRIKTCPIVRAKDGLAMSSRNRYLSKNQRIRAGSIYQSLKEAKKMILTGERNPLRVKAKIRLILEGHVDKIDYSAVANPENLRSMKRIKLPVLVALACFVGRTRLIDNMVVKS